MNPVLQSRLPYRIALAGCVVWVALGVLTSPATLSAEFDESKLPPPAGGEVLFDRDIKPIFEATCFRCHGPERPKSKFSLDQRDTALKGGANGVDILPGRSGASPLIHYVSRLVEDMEMPPPDKGEPLTREQVGLLRTWIDQGAPWSGTTNASASQLTYSLTPFMQWITVNGNERTFREHSWTREGGSGGVLDFRLQEKRAEGETLRIEGRSVANQDDYRIALAGDKSDVGFFRGGYEQYRKFFDDSGGYYAPFMPSSFALDRDLSLKMGRAWFDVGLTLPDWPRMVIGYEYQLKDGTKPTLQWGQAAFGVDPSVVRGIYPASKEINEQTHVLKFDLTHEIYGVSIENNFRGEFYDLRTTRLNANFISPKNDDFMRYNEGYQHFQGANMFRLEKHVRDWLFVSAGYLYSKLNADATFAQVEIIDLRSSAPSFFREDQSQQILLSRESSVFNANALLEPWRGLTFSAGVQPEWTRQEGLGTLLAFGSVPTSLTGDSTKTAVEENFALRYTAIPFTVLYVEERFQQESFGLFERQFADQAGDDGSHNYFGFQRGTEAASDRKEHRVGFTVSPWPRVSLNAHYRHRDRRSDYDHGQDFGGFDTNGAPSPGLGGVDADGNLIPGPANGYPAFIRARDLASDEVEAKLVLRPVTWMKATLKYQLVASDFRTTTDPAADPATEVTVPGSASPGGGIFAGNSDAHIYSLNAALTPWSRWYSSTTFVYSDSRTVSGVNNDSSLVPYRGGTFSLMTSATFVLDARTDLNAGYSFSHADFRQNNVSEGLPLGIVYAMHGLQAGVTRRFKHGVSSNLQYGFYRYREPTGGTTQDYTAHAVFASITLKWPGER